MLNNEPLTYVSNEEKQMIVDAIWKDIHDKQTQLSQQVSPKAFVLGGQPGAGKSTSTDKLEIGYKKNIITIDLDSYRARHPNYQALYEKYGKELSSYTHQFAGEIKDKIQKRAVDNKYNIIIDGTLGNLDRTEQLINNLKNNDYQVYVLIHTCSKDISWNSVNNRYENALKAGEIPRHVPKEVHDQIVESLPKNVDKLSQSTKIEYLIVHNREEKIYDSRIDNSLPSIAIQAEMNKNKLSKNNLTQSSNEAFSKVRQLATKKLDSKESLLNQKSLNKSTDKGVER
ncbi:zeta toxin family protein [Orbus wheelerorum]|uniref:zeta toxin family protein n=1 Tax=Orbus wheelerorum TaxID=3074111 RepID=UPI00370D409A